MVTTREQYAAIRRADLALLERRPFDEQQTIAREIIRGMLTQFHREWTDLQTRESDAARVHATNSLLDRYSHQLYDVVCDMEAVLGEDLVVEIRCLTADMIKTTNVLIMLGCGEECRAESDALAKEALRQVERCLTLVQAKGGGLATRVFIVHREE
ncbi:MAG: hypothetical protein M0P21_08465 [Methanoculleus sp.]|jgi:hypothetical protein|uniref:hypothetical protein n=1 Tax=Methanoculleus nereidis TaxID=2735141 RepID=UPI0026846549|nr:hypothetical protein [Methanoculleus sp. YWC-01]MCK9298981.1 hypothetical protein [Methanoculleus sp.]